MDEVVLAKDINGCENCPLCGNDCPGGYTSGPGGTPIEPPCCSWSEDTEVYEGMYDDDPRDYSNDDDAAYVAETARVANSREQAQKEEIERLRNRVRSITGGDYRHIELRERGSACNDWLCPYCGTWRRVASESWHGGIGEAWCSKCQRTMVFCSELEEMK